MQGAALWKNLNIRLVIIKWVFFGDFWQRLIGKIWKKLIEKKLSLQVCKMSNEILRHHLTLRIPVVLLLRGCIWR